MLVESANSGILQDQLGFSANPVPRTLSDLRDEWVVKIILLCSKVGYSSMKLFSFLARL